MEKSARSSLRLITDLQSVREDPPWGCSASPLFDSSLVFWTATVSGPHGGCWEGEVFPLLIEFGDDYPEKPPSVRFTCDIFHPNVYSTGELDMNVLWTTWSPCYDISTILTSIQHLLSEPNCLIPVNEQAANLYLTDKPSYNRKVREVIKKNSLK
eukprot:g2209.t1